MELTSKKCSKCAVDKAIAEFYKGDSRGGKQSWCKRCHDVMSVRWRKSHRLQANALSRASRIRRRPKILAYLRDHYQKNRPRKLAAAKQRCNSLKAAAYQAYGGYSCACCGETHPAFLSIDHVNNDGGQHRRTVGRGANIYQWLKTHDYPAGFQVLCHNCNHGKHLNGGLCPHVEAQRGLRFGDEVA